MEVSVSMRIEKPRDEVAPLLCDFGRMHEWHPALEACVVESGGEVRTVTLGGKPYRDKLVSVASDGFGYCYEQLEGPLPIASMRSCVAVLRADADSCDVEWSAQVEPGTLPPEAVESALVALMKVGLTGAKQKFELAHLRPE